MTVLALIFLNAFAYWKVFTYLIKQLLVNPLLSANNCQWIIIITIKYFLFEEEIGLSIYILSRRAPTLDLKRRLFFLQKDLSLQNKHCMFCTRSCLQFAQ